MRKFRNLPKIVFLTVILLITHTLIRSASVHTKKNLLRSENKSLNRRLRLLHLNSKPNTRKSLVMLTPAKHLLS